MKKAKLTVLALALILAVAVVAGCGSGDGKSPQAAQPQKQQDAHAGHAMPSGDPMPLMKDMDKNLQDMMKQVKAGQMMEAQKSAGQIAALADKVLPHMNDAAAKAGLQKAAGELRDSVGGAKVDQTVVETKLKALQGAMAPAMKNLQAGSHNH
jgi:ABC-type phosphate transport system substrate-binding protein